MKVSIKYAPLSAEWEVRYGGRTYYSTPSWTEAIQYAAVLAKFMKDSSRLY